MYKQDKATTERNARTLRELVKRPDNKVCADCKRNDPRWASWNIGVFVCIRCSGIHRSMGTHISKVKSVDLDTWTPEQMASIQKWGNRRANIYWEAHLKAGHVPPDHKVESFIRSKYESRRWAMEGPPPEDPSVLDQEQATQEPAPTPAVQAVVAEAQSSSPRSQSPANAAGRTAHPLLSTAMMSTNRARASPSTASPSSAPSQSPAPPPAPPAPAPAVDDLFSLDFHSPAPATSAATTAASTSPPRKDVKNDIMSLFSASSPPVASAIPTNTAAWGGANAWGAPAQQSAAAAAASDPWGSFTSAPPPAQPASQSFFGSPTGQQAFGGGFGAFQQPTSNASLFGSSSNVWASPATNPAPAPGSNGFGGAGLWGSSTSATTAQPATKKQDDAFGDLWS